MPLTYRIKIKCSLQFQKWHIYTKRKKREFGQFYSKQSIYLVEVNSKSKYIYTILLLNYLISIQYLKIKIIFSHIKNIPRYPLLYFVRLETRLNIKRHKSTLIIVLKYYYKYKYIKFSKITKKAVFKQSSKRWNNLGQSMNHNAWTPPPPKKKSIYQLSKKWRYLCSKQAILFLTMYQTERPR